MTSSTHKDLARQGLPPNFFSVLRDQWFKKFFETCELLHEFKPYMSGEDLEEQAHDTTVKYFYLKSLKELKYARQNMEWIDVSWR
jgi:hypothetical protein